MTFWVIPKTPGQKVFKGQYQIRYSNWFALIYSSQISQMKENLKLLPPRNWTARYTKRGCNFKWKSCPKSSQKYGHCDVCCHIYCQVKYDSWVVFLIFHHFLPFFLMFFVIFCSHFSRPNGVSPIPKTFGWIFRCVKKSSNFLPRRSATAWRMKLSQRSLEKTGWFLDDQLMKSLMGWWKYPGSQPPLKKWWFLLEDDKRLLNQWWFGNQPIKNVGWTSRE